MLKEQEKQSISAAVAKAEERSAGEIVVAIIPESDSYAFRELLFSLAIGALSFFILATQSERIYAVLDAQLWNTPRSYLPLVLFSASVLITVLVYIASQIPALDRLIIGKRAMQKSVEQRALRYAMESGVCNTSNRSGVLLFVSELERRACILADVGVQKALESASEQASTRKGGVSGGSASGSGASGDLDSSSADVWEEAIRRLSSGIKAQGLCNAIVTAVGDIGDILAEHFPLADTSTPSNTSALSKATDKAAGTSTLTNELSNAPREIEKGS